MCFSTRLSAALAVALRGLSVRLAREPLQGESVDFLWLLLRHDRTSLKLPRPTRTYTPQEKGRRSAGTEKRDKTMLIVLFFQCYSAIHRGTGERHPRDLSLLHDFIPVAQIFDDNSSSPLRRAVDKDDRGGQKERRGARANPRASPLFLVSMDLDMLETRPTKTRNRLIF
jgi:hypothetical protein